MAVGTLDKYRRRVQSKPQLRAPFAVEIGMDRDAVPDLKLIDLRMGAGPFTLGVSPQGGKRCRQPIRRSVEHERSLKFSRCHKSH